MSTSNAFVELLLAAMKDAVTTGHITQIQTQFAPNGDNKLEVVRIVVLPEKMNFAWPSHSPLGAGGPERN